MWSIFYNGLLWLARGVFPVYAAAARLRGVDRAELSQRLGFVEPRHGDDVWIQAASVGEVAVAARLIAGLREAAASGTSSTLPIYLTTTTRTGQARARQVLNGGGQVGYFPLDFPDSIRRTLERLRPALLVLVETEVWPTLLAEARRRAIPVVIVNGRISDRAFRRYRMAAPLFGRALAGVTLACVQSSRDAERFTALGLAPERIRITGSLKFSDPVLTAPSDSLLADLGLTREDELWVAGSTAEGEEGAILSAFAALPPARSHRRVLVLAPRRPERFTAVAELLTASGCAWRRRTRPDGDSDVILLDTIGELPLLYRWASVAFVGGSLAPVGGHNILEPAACGVAPIFGPHVENIRDAAARLLEADAAFQVADGAALAELFARLEASPALRGQAGARARRVVEENAHALEETLRALRPLIPSAFAHA